MDGNRCGQEGCPVAVFIAEDLNKTLTEDTDVESLYDEKDAHRCPTSFY